MDNETIYMSERVVDMIREAGALLIFTAPYSPHLNPIEYFFSSYKAALRRIRYESELEWFDAHCEALLSVSPEGARNTFRDCDYPFAAEYCSKMNVMKIIRRLLPILAVAAANAQQGLH